MLRGDFLCGLSSMEHCKGGSTNEKCACKYISHLCCSPYTAPLIGGFTLWSKVKKLLKLGNLVGQEVRINLRIVYTKVVHIVQIGELSHQILRSYQWLIRLELFLLLLL